MKTINRLLSLTVVLLMLCAAAITVNKTIFGHSLSPRDQTIPQETVTQDQAITLLPDSTIIIHTVHLTGTINGYAGEVPLDIHIRKNKITRIEALPNSETPTFLHRASQLLPLWEGKTLAEASEMKVDAITGATFTSTAIINNVDIGLNYYRGITSKPRPEIPLKIWIALAITLAACILPLFVKNKIYHNIQLVANVIILGFWAGQFLDFTLFLKTLSTGISFPIGLSVSLMLIAAFIFPLFGHPQHYCTHICPLGSAQQLMAQICNYKIKISPKALKTLDWIRKILWAILMLLLWTDTLVTWIDYEAFQAFQFRSAPPLIIAIAATFILLSAIITRPYCRFICPTGSLLKRSDNID